MKHKKTLLTILSLMIFCAVFLCSSVLYKEFWTRSSAGDSENTTTTKVINNSGEKILTVDTTFYNYRYDNEIYHNTRNQGSQSCYDSAVIPFGAFDSKLSDYYKSNGVKHGIYTGNFYNYYGGLPGVGANKQPFPGYYNFAWAANIANRHSPYNSVCQGIVSSNLDSFPDTIDHDTNINKGTLMTATSSGQVAVPYFDTDFLKKKVNNVPIGEVKEHVGFPFRLVTSGDKKGYYEFDSTKDVVRFDGMCKSSPSQKSYYFGENGQLQYYYNNDQRVYFKGSTAAQFLPFNNPGDGQSALDYGFGARFNIPFYLSDDGKINGKNMVFEFSGDDDVWIFLDGQLVLDLGGQHGKATGTIDFGGNNKKIKVTTSHVSFVNGSTDATDTVESNKILAEETYVKSVSKTLSPDDGTLPSNFQKGDTHPHVLTIFYMERGMFESNFHMAFNFVPEGVEPTPTPTAIPERPATAEPVATAIPTPTPVNQTPTPANETPTPTPRVDRLTIQNKLKFPTGDSKINEAFEQTVQDLAEEDVFQYKVENKGTETADVEDIVKVPSGVLTVRQNDKTTNKDRSYLSFGAQPKIRIYIDLQSIEDRYQNFQRVDNSNTTTPFKNFTFDDILNASDVVKQTEHLAYNITSLKITGDNYCIEKLPVYDKDNKIVYFDAPISGKHFKISMELDGNGVKVALVKNDVTNNVSFEDPDDGKLRDGYLYKVGTTSGNWDRMILSDDETWEKANSSHPGLGMPRYSSGLPFQEKGTDASYTFKPTTKDDFQTVGTTAFELCEAYPADLGEFEVIKTDSTTKKFNILINNATTSAITATDGTFGMFYDDHATFLKQFSYGSRMRVTQTDNLLQPSRYPETSLSEKTLSGTSPQQVTQYATSSRLTNDYYYTEVKTKSRSDDGTIKSDVDVTYDGQYDFSNTGSIPLQDPVNITQTFTNTVKTGSLRISKEMDGTLDVDNKNQTTYGFKVSFSNVFGGSDNTQKAYTGSYTLVEKDGTKTEETLATNNTIIKLKPNQTAIISGIPVGTKYTIEEVTEDGLDVSDGTVVSDIQVKYVAKTENNSDSDDGDSDKSSITSPVYQTAASDKYISTIDKDARIITGTIPCQVVNQLYGSATDEFTDVDVSITYTNQYGTITISKKIAGDVENIAFYKDADGNTIEPTYNLYVHDQTSDQPYSGKYLVYTYSKKVDSDAYTTPEVSIDERETTDGIIPLKEGEMAKICKIDLAKDVPTYVISEQVDPEAIYFMEELKEITQSDTSTASNTDTLEVKLDKTKPSFNALCVNRYSHAYLQIEKYVDKLYYGNKEYGGGLTYQELSDAKQSFRFTIKQYKTYADAVKGADDDTCERTFQTVLKLGEDEDTEEFENVQTVSLGDSTPYSYKYKITKTIHVLGNRYYRIEEDPNWSWKYDLQGIGIKDTFVSPNIDKTSTDKGLGVNGTDVVESDTNKHVVILHSHLDPEDKITNKRMPIAQFYNALNTDKNGETDGIDGIEGDTDDEINLIIAPSATPKEYN